MSLDLFFISGAFIFGIVLLLGLIFAWRKKYASTWQMLLGIVLIGLTQLAVLVNELQYDNSLPKQDIPTIVFKNKFDQIDKIDINDRRWSFVDEISLLRDSQKNANPKIDALVQQTKGPNSGYNSDGLPLAWSLLVITDNKDKQYLRAIRTKLWKKKYPAYILSNRDQVEQIAIGPFLDKNEALQSQRRIRQALQIRTTMFIYKV